MLQNSGVLQLSCNQKDHTKQYISAICTRKDCDKQSALCQRCILPFHKSCEDHITFLEDLPNLLDKTEDQIAEVVQLIESLIKQLREIQNMYRQTLKPILDYKAIPNMTNLNIAGSMFRQDQKIDLDSIRIGTNLIKGIIESYLSPLKPKELTEQEKKDAEQWRAKCQESYNKNENSKAIECIDKALTINPKSDVYWHWKGIHQSQGLGFVLNNLGKYEEAIQCYDTALKINPQFDTIWNNKGIHLRQGLGMALNNLGKYEEAIQFDSAWSNKGIHLRQGLGLALDNQKKYEEAIQCYDTALKINPQFDKAWSNKGFALNNLGKYEEAIQCYDTALKINPQNDTAWSNKGLALNNFKKYEEAIQCYDKSLNIESNYLTYYNKSLPLESLNKLKEAEDCLKKALELNNNHQDTKDRLKAIQAILKK